MPASPGVVTDHFGFPDQDDSTSDRCAPWVRPMVGMVHVGGWSLVPQFFSPNPRGLLYLPELHYCDCCGYDFTTATAYHMHATVCQRNSLGNEIYRDESRQLSLWECRGSDEAAGPGCQRFCLLAKHFLDHKETFLDVESFIFYLLFHYDEHGHHFIGYFSRDRQPQCLCNLACIAVLPPYQSLGLGSFLIEMSYQLAARDGRQGTPERPITQQGRRAYTAVWCRLVAQALLFEWKTPPSIQDICSRTAMLPCDVLSTLVFLGALRSVDGQHVLRISKRVLDWSRKAPKIPIDSDMLHY